jgi:hypothetical protein
MGFHYRGIDASPGFLKKILILFPELPEAEKNFDRSMYHKSPW